MTENTQTPGQEPNRPSDQPAPEAPLAPPAAPVPFVPPTPVLPEAIAGAPAPGPAGDATAPWPVGDAPAPSGAAAPDAAASEPPAPVAPEAPPALDEGTYDRLREPRSENRLALDGSWHQISPKYVVSQTLQNALFVVVVVIAAFAVTLFTDTDWWPWIPAGALIVSTVIAQIIIPRQARALGYMLRENDLVFRKGILWQRMVAVPYGRMQLVDITHGPLDRAFGIAKLKMITAAATTGVEIPGLGQQAAEALRDTLIDVAETRRTGL